MKKKYLYNGKIYTEDQVMEAAKASKMDLNTYVSKAGFEYVADNYNYNGKSYSAEQILEGATASGKSFYDYIDTIKGTPAVEKKNLVESSGASAGFSSDGKSKEKKRTTDLLADNLGLNEKQEPKKEKQPVATQPAASKPVTENRVTGTKTFNADDPTNQGFSDEMDTRPESAYNGVPKESSTDFFKQGYKPKPISQAKQELAAIADRQSGVDAENVNKPFQIPTNLPTPTDAISELMYGSKGRAIMAGDLEVLKEVVNNEKELIEREKAKLKSPSGNWNALTNRDDENDAVNAEKRKSINELNSLYQSVASDALRIYSDKVVEDNAGKTSVDDYQNAGASIRKFSSDIGVRSRVDNSIDNFSDQQRQVEFLKDKVNYTFNRKGFFDKVSVGKDKYDQEFNFNNYTTFLGAKIEADANKLEAMATPKVQAFLASDKETTDDPEILNYLNKYFDLRKTVDQAKKSPDLYPKVKEQIKANQVFEAYGKYVDERRKTVAGESLQNVADLFSGYKLDEESEYKAVSEITGIPIDEVRDIVKANPESGYLPSHIRKAVNSAGAVLTNIEQWINRVSMPDGKADVINREIGEKDILKTPEAYKLSTNNITIRSVMDGMATGVGQFAAYASLGALGGEVLMMGRARALTTSIADGGLSAEANAFLNAYNRAATSASTIATGYGSSYEAAYKEAARFTNDESKRNQYAKEDAFINGVSELLLQDVALAKQLTKSGSMKVLNAIKSGKVLTQTESMLLRAGEFTRVMGLETAEEMMPLIYETIAKDKMFDYKTSRDEFFKQMYETALVTAVSTLPIAIGAGMKSPTSTFTKSALYGVGQNAELYTNKINDLVKSGNISQADGNQRAMIVNTMGTIVPEVEQMAKDGGFENDADRKMEIASQLLRKRVNQKITENAKNPEVTKQYDKDNADADAIIAAAADVDSRSEKLSAKWKKNIVAIGERTDISEEEKEKLKNEEDIRHASDYDQLRQDKELYFRVKNRGTKLNNILDDRDKIASIDELSDQAVLNPHNIYEKLDRDAELTIDLVARNGVEKIEKSRERLNNELKKEETTEARAEQIYDNILLLKRALVRAKRNEKIKGEPLVQKSEKEDILTEPENISQPIEKRSILNQGTDLLGDDKELWMFDVSGRGAGFDKRGVVTEKGELGTEFDPTVMFRGEIGIALNEGKFEKAISDGRMTATDAKKIIEGAGLEVPQDILIDAGVESSPQPIVNEGGKGEVLKDVESTAKALQQKYKEGIGDFDDTILRAEIDPNKKSNYSISEAYHKAKQDGSNPELVKAVEELLSTQKQTVNEATRGGEKGFKTKKEIFELPEEERTVHIDDLIYGKEEGLNAPEDIVRPEESVYVPTLPIANIGVDTISVREALEHLIENKNKFSDLAQQVLDTSDLESLKSIVTISPSSGYRSKYLTKQDRVVLDKADAKNATIIIHEIIHAATSKKIPIDVKRSADGYGKKYLKNLNDYLKNDKGDNDVKSLIKLYLKAAKELGHYDALFSGSTSVRELRNTGRITFSEGKPYYMVFHSNDGIEAKRIERKLKELGVDGGSFSQGRSYAWQTVVRDNDGTKINKILESGIVNKDNGSEWFSFKFNYDEKLNATGGNADLTVKRGAPYGIGNLDEFLAEAFSSESFQKKLASIKYEDGTNLWQKFVGAIKRLLGIETEGTLLNAVIKTGAEIISKKRDAAIKRLDELSSPSKIDLEAAKKRMTEAGFTEAEIKNEFEKRGLIYETTNQEGVASPESVPGQETKFNENTVGETGEAASGNEKVPAEQKSTKPAVILPGDNKAPNVIPPTKKESEENKEVEDFVIEDREKLSDALFELADKILKGNLGGEGATQLSIFSIPQQVLGRVIQAIAIGVKASETVAQIIARAWKIITDEGLENQIDKSEFDGAVVSMLKGEKPRVRVKVGVDEQQTKQSIEEEEFVFGNFKGDAIGEYKLTTSGLVEAFMTDETFEKVFGDDKTDDRYAVQKLADMLEDGKEMIGAAQTMFGGMDIMEYGPKLLHYLKTKMSDDVSASNKKAVLMATFMGELKTELQRKGGERAKGLYNQTYDYYRSYMNKISKSLVAGRLLRLYRDKYLSDVFHDRVLEDDQMRKLRATQSAEMEAEFTEDDLMRFAITVLGRPVEDIEEEQKSENKKRKEKGANQKKQTKKEKFQDRAAAKSEDVKKKYGSTKSLTEDIINKIKNLNCK